jgi:hypothetical protein
MRKPLTEADKLHLEELNARVISAIADRRDWLDSKMSEYAEMQVGDGVYDLESGVRAGTVSALTRFWRDIEAGVNDTSLQINYKFEISKGNFDNTSRQPHKLGSKDEAALSAWWQLKALSYED